MSLADLTAAQLAQKIAAGETTATDAVNDCLTRIEAREGTVPGHIWTRFLPVGRQKSWMRSGHPVPHSARCMVYQLASRTSSIPMTCRPNMARC